MAQSNFAQPCRDYVTLNFCNQLPADFWIKPNVLDSCLNSCIIPTLASVFVLIPFSCHEGYWTDIEQILKCSGHRIKHTYLKHTIWFLTHVHTQVARTTVETVNLSPALKSCIWLLCYKCFCAFMFPFAIYSFAFIQMASLLNYIEKFPCCIFSSSCPLPPSNPILI